MSTYIDPNAVVHPNAQIGEGCHIGPFCTVSEHAKIGANTRLQSHVVVDGYTTIGANCHIFPFASIGTQSQDLKFKEGNICYTTIGDNCKIREYVTIHAGTDHNTTTSVGNNCALLALSHVGHNCEVGNNVVLSHNATLGGHVIVDDHVNVGGLSAVHQFVRIGRNAMVAGMARVVQDILPFTIAEGTPANMRIVNKIGMERCGYDSEATSIARKAFRILFKQDLKVDDAVAKLTEEFGDHPVIVEIIKEIDLGERGLARPN